MDRNEIIKAILVKGFSKNDKPIPLDNEIVREKLMDIYAIHPDTKDRSFSDFEKLSDNSIEGTFYFEQLRNKSFRPVPHSEATSIKCKTINVATIINASDNVYYNKESKSSKDTVKIMAYLFGYPLNERQIEVIDEKRDNTDTALSLLNYLASIQFAYKKEDVLAQLVHILTVEDHHTVTLCTNDIQFIITLTPSIIVFIHKGKKLNILFDPPSMYDLVSYRLMLLQQFGASISILPIKNKYPVHGVFPDWDITQEESTIKKALIFTNNLFNEIRDGRVFAKKTESVREIQDAIQKIRLHHEKIHPSLHAVPLNQHYQFNIEVVSEKVYLDYLKKQFQASERSDIYSNAEIKFETIPLESIFRRKNTFTKYRLGQQRQFMEYAISKGWVEINETTSTLLFKPIFIRMAEGAVSPINPPFVEFNPGTEGYQIEEGHIRLWLCYHVYNVKYVRVILVENIPTKYFTIIDKKRVEKQKLLVQFSWEETIAQIREESIHNQDYYLESRQIENITHQLPRKTLNSLMNTMIDEFIQRDILSKVDKELHQYLQ